MAGIVYFARHSESGLVKIGKTKNLAMFQSQSGVRLINSLQVDDDSRTLAFIKNSFSSRSRGSNLYEISKTEIDETIDFLKRQLAAVPSKSNVEAIRLVSDLLPATTASERQLELVTQLLRYREELARVEFLLKNTELQIIETIGESAGIRNLVSFKCRTTTRIDGTRLREELPDIYSKYCTTSTTRVFLLRVEEDN